VRGRGEWATLRGRCEKAGARKCGAGLDASYRDAERSGYVAATREVWVTLRVKAGDNAPAKSLEVFDASDPHHLKQKTGIPLESLAESYAVDNQRGLFYTNIEDTGSTVAIDVRMHKIVAKWNPGSSDLQGLALDSARRFLFVACGDHVVSLDAAHDGKILDSLQTGA